MMNIQNYSFYDFLIYLRYVWWKYKYIQVSRHLILWKGIFAIVTPSGLKRGHRYFWIQREFLNFTIFSPRASPRRLFPPPSASGVGILRLYNISFPPPTRSIHRFSPNEFSPKVTNYWEKCTRSIQFIAFK